MANEWPEVAFGELLAGGTRNGVYKSKEHHGKGVKIVNMGELFAYPRLGDVPMKRVQLTEDEIDKTSLRVGDLLFARRSLVAEGAGRCSLVVDVGEPTSFESSIIRARPKPGIADSLFLFYFFSSPEGRQRVGTILRQVAVSGITGGDLVKLYVPLPPLAEQRAIAAVLGALDDKIELNRRMNATLEGLARALFRSWFVDFDPVRAKMDRRHNVGAGLVPAQEGPAQEGNHKGLPLPPAIDALFPDEMEVGEDGGERPRGWGSGRLEEVAENPRRSIWPENIEPETPYIALEHMPRKSITLNDWGVADALESNKYEFKRGEILFGKLRPYFHKVGVAPVDGVCSTDILVIRPKTSDWFGFVLGHVSSVELVDHTTALSTGTKMPRTNWSDIAQYGVTLPPTSLAAAYTDLTNQLVARILANIEESRTLAALRDGLLPGLMSGAVRVTQAEEAMTHAL